MGRTSESSDGASTYSDSTTCSYSKDFTKDALSSSSSSRRGVRQRVREVVADLGSPPTTKQDAKEGKRTQTHVDVGPVEMDGSQGITQNTPHLTSIAAERRSPVNTIAFTTLPSHNPSASTRLVLANDSNHASHRLVPAAKW
ncbi:hypothetical protein G7046_g5789 [Stylonectria norvegica]|nr:hypothetical protein G7046_g5789 [Stylonectria norvegica]